LQSGSSVNRGIKGRYSHLPILLLFTLPFYNCLPIQWISQLHQNENERSQRAFRVALVQSLLGREGPTGRNRFLAIRITRGHQLLLPTISRFPAYTHQIRRGSPYRECYYCRWKHFKGQIRRDEINRRRTCCADCDVPLCRGCFTEYHRGGGSIWEGYYEGPKVLITSL
jgi:hypothetical protein